MISTSPRRLLTTAWTYNHNNGQRTKREYNGQDGVHCIPVTNVRSAGALLRSRARAITAALPEAEERIAWSMLTFWKKHNIIRFAGTKNHVGLYPGPEAVAEFAGRLKEYKTSKGTIQLPYSRPVLMELISDIARWCYETGNHP